MQLLPVSTLLLYVSQCVQKVIQCVQKVFPDNCAMHDAHACLLVFLASSQQIIRPF